MKIPCRPTNIQFCTTARDALSPAPADDQIAASSVNSGLPGGCLDHKSAHACSLQPGPLQGQEPQATESPGSLLWTCPACACSHQVADTYMARVEGEIVVHLLKHFLISFPLLRIQELNLHKLKSSVHHSRMLLNFTLFLLGRYSHHGEEWGTVGPPGSMS